MSITRLSSQLVKFEVEQTIMSCLLMTRLYLFNPVLKFFIANIFRSFWIAKPSYNALEWEFGEIKFLFLIKTFLFIIQSLIAKLVVVAKNIYSFHIFCISCRHSTCCHFVCITNAIIHSSLIIVKKTIVFVFIHCHQILCPPLTNYFTSFPFLYSLIRIRHNHLALTLDNTHGWWLCLRF